MEHTWKSICKILQGLGFLGFAIWVSGLGWRFKLLWLIGLRSITGQKPCAGFMAFVSLWGFFSVFRNFGGGEGVSEWV